MTVNGPRWFQTVTAAESPQRKRLAALESALAAGRDSTGPLSAEGRAALEKNIAQRKAEQAELGATAAVMPDLTFDRELVLRLGNREVQIRNWGRGNTPGDATIYLPAERILFAGDLLVHPVPYAYNSTPIEWIAVLSQLERLPVTGLVPGHGPVMKDHQYTRQVRELLEFVVGEVEKLATNGKTLPQIQQSLELGAYRSRFVGTSPIDQLVWDDSIRRALIERAWLGWRGGN
jgi:glyoxylase-like metal-dependent hydrolase (beta-lactamase superfamily II)